LLEIHRIEKWGHEADRADQGNHRHREAKGKTPHRLLKRAFDFEIEPS